VALNKAVVWIHRISTPSPSTRRSTTLAAIEVDV
jgi:hypothetical protein